MITKKDIFEAKLKGQPLALTGSGHREWVEIITFLCEEGILQRTNRASMDKSTREYRVLYDIIIRDEGRTQYVLRFFSYHSGCYVLRLVACQNLPEDLA